MQLKKILIGVATTGVGLVLGLNLVSANGVPTLRVDDPTIPRTDVVDISSNNGVPSVRDFKIMKQYGVQTIMVKLTEFTTYRNPYARQQIANARAAGLKIGAYHYSWYTTPQEAKGEAQYFAQYARQLGLGTATPMADDLEDHYTQKNNVTNNVKAFRSALAESGYRNALLYTYTSYVATTGLRTHEYGHQRIWMAQYPYAPSKTNLWNAQYGMWQFNSRMTFPGVAGMFDATIDYVGAVSTPAQPQHQWSTIKASKQVHYEAKILNSHNGIYQNQPWNVKGAQFLGRGSQYAQRQVTVTEEKLTDNGVWWVGFKLNGQMVWMDKQAIEQVLVTQAADANFFVQQKGRRDGLYLNKPYGIVGARYAGQISQRTDGDRPIHVTKTATVDGTHWAYAVIDGQGYWFDQRAGVFDQTRAKSVNYQATIDQQNRHDGLYANQPWNYYGQYVGRANPYHGQTVQIIREWTTPLGNTWVAFNLNGRLVWLDKQGIGPALATQATDTNFFVQEHGRRDGLYLHSPYGVVGARYAGQISQRTDGDRPIRVTKTATVEGTRWAYAVIDGQGYWFDQRAGIFDHTQAQTVNYQAIINQQGRHDGLYANQPWNYYGQYVGRANPYHGQRIQVIREWTTPLGNTWVGYRLNGQLVWLDKQGIKVSQVTPAQPVNWTFFVQQRGRRDGLYLNQPYGLNGAQYAGQISQVTDAQRPVQVTKTMVVEGTHWVYALINGRGYWVDQRAGIIDQTQAKSVNYQATINQVSRRDGLYADKPWNYYGRYVGNAHNYHGRKIQVIREWTTPLGSTWVAFNLNGQMVWMDKAGVQK